MKNATFKVFSFIFLFLSIFLLLKKLIKLLTEYEFHVIMLIFVVLLIIDLLLIFVTLLLNFKRILMFFIFMSVVISNLFSLILFSQCEERVVFDYQYANTLLDKLDVLSCTCYGVKTRLNPIYNQSYYDSPFRGMQCIGLKIK